MSIDQFANSLRDCDETSPYRRLMEADLELFAGGLESGSPPEEQQSQARWWPWL